MDGLRITGTYHETAVGGENVRAFVPHPLPPIDPSLLIDDAMQTRIAAAEAALARLSVAGEMVPSIDWFLYAFVRKEAVVSSQIEGTQATLVDLLEFEARGQAGRANEAEVREVCNYIEALEFARGELNSAKGLPLSVRLLNESHARLMRGTRGSDKMPGEPRRTQNWIGGSRPSNAVYVPPPAHMLPGLLSDFERFLHEEDDLAPLVRAGMLHVQFETIHPYLDGNGRIGRLLVSLILEQWGLLNRPLLYLSLYFKRHRQEYYRRLGAVRTEGDWEGWTHFFLEAVATIADEAVATARALFALVAEDRGRVLAVPSSSAAAARVFELLPSHPVLTIVRVMELLDTTRPTATKALKAVVDAGILTETSGRKRDRVYAYAAYLDLLGEGTEI
jgi:Fic family protein